MGDVVGEVSWREVADQNDVADDELATDGFSDLRASLSYAADVGDHRLEVFINGRNLTDDEQRLHTSFIGQLAPQPGRTLEAGVRYHL
jgi:iron complex outermembrane receptor protein